MTLILIMCAVVALMFAGVSLAEFKARPSLGRFLWVPFFILEGLFVILVLMGDASRTAC